MTLALISIDLLWRNALAAVPLAIVVALLCRCLPVRSSTRHAMWVIVLLSLVMPPIIPGYDVTTDFPKVLTASNETPSPAHHEVASPATPIVDARVPLHEMPVQRLPNNSMIGGPLESLFAMTKAAASAAPVRNTVPNPILAPAPIADLQSHPTIVRETNPLTAGMGTSLPRSSARKSLSSVSTPGASLPWNASNSIASVPVVDRVQSLNRADSSPVSKPVESPAATAGNVETSLVIPWREWFDGVMRVRDAIVQMSPIPLTMWFGGCALIVLVLLVRTLRFRHVLKNASAAGAFVQIEVERASREIGLKHPPRTLMTDARVSPMIWCGLSRVLLLPTSLWKELDAAGRRAVLLHELAHLRRRDHWVRWGELLIGCLYWWHPVVWFIRKKLRDEADHCCDAWVTSLLPASRTSYARALLATRQYISASHNATPAVGLGIANNRTKLFARRLTMVMTERSTPRLSAFGGGMTLCLAMAAWLAAPLWACPPEEAKAKAAVEAKTALKAAAAAEKAAKARGQGQSPRAVIIDAPDASTFEQHMLKRELEAAAQGGRAPTPHPEGSHGRLEELERRLEMLTEQLEHMMQERGGQPQARAGQPSVASPRLRSTVVAPSAPRMRSPMAVTVAPRHPGHPGEAHPGHVAPPQPPMAPTPPTPPSPPAPPTPPSMPMLPAPAMGSGPSVYYAPGAFGGQAALNMQDGETITRVYKLPQGKLEALYALMARNDVPVWVSSTGDGISVQATPRQHEAFQSFVLLIHPEGGRAAQVQGQLFETRNAQALTERAYAQALKAGADQRKRQVETMQRSMKQQQQELKRQVREQQRRAEELSRKARDVEKKSSRMHDDAESIEDELKREELLAQAEALEAEHEALEAQAESHLDHASSIEDMIAALEEELEAALEALEEQYEAELEANAEAEIAMIESDVQAQIAALEAEIASAASEAAAEEAEAVAEAEVAAAAAAEKVAEQAAKEAAEEAAKVVEQPKPNT